MKTEVPTQISYGKPISIIQFFKLIVSALLGGRDDFVVNYGLLKDSGLINIDCYCDQKDVGMLLGRKEAGLSVPTKWSILRLLGIMAYQSGIKSVNLKIDDFSKMPKKEVTNDKENES